MDWKETVTSMSDKVFPGLSHKVEKSGNEVTSNLSLQMTLYFNVIFVPIWIIVSALFLVENVASYSELNRFVILTVIVSTTFVEILRLYLGYEGNLKDKVPELAGFWMLSVLLQFPLHGVILLNSSFGLSILEVTVQSIIFLMLVLEILFGYAALKYTATQQATYFRIMKLKSHVTYKDIQEKYKIN